MGNVSVVKILGWSRRGGLDETGTVSLAGVGIECELRYDECLTTGVAKRLVHLVISVSEYAQVRGLLGKLGGISFSITVPDAEQNNKTPVDRGDAVAVDGDASAADSLYQSLHVVSRSCFLFDKYDVFRLVFNGIRWWMRMERRLGQMGDPLDKLDFWYAVNNTEIISLPTRHLETFGVTILNYYLISELMDSVDRVRVREGRIQAYRPKIVMPNSFSDSVLEGFGSEANDYVDWLRQNMSDLRILQYGFKIKKEEFSEEVITESMPAVTDKVQKQVSTKNEPFSAVLTGVDKPGEVCLIKLMVEVVRRSLQGNVNDLEKRNMFGETDGIPNSVRLEIEETFLLAARDASLIKQLAARLKRYGVFRSYEDRFFALVRAAGK